MVRAILAQPRLMVLDEATSGVDSDHERQLLKLLWQAAPDRAYLAILHRPDNLDLFNAVYRLEDGRLEQLPEPVLQQ